jgi:hypothetical protein
MQEDRFNLVLLVSPVEHNLVMPSLPYTSMDLQAILDSPLFAWVQAQE